jgi:phage tail sheath gpL-like
VVSCVVDRAVCALSAGPWLDDGDPASGAAASRTSAGASSLLDERAARLLASLGIESTVEPDYLLVTANAAAAASAPRWAVVDPSGSPP